MGRRWFGIDGEPQAARDTCQLAMLAAARAGQRPTCTCRRHTPADELRAATAANA